MAENREMVGYVVWDPETKVFLKTWQSSKPRLFASTAGAKQSIDNFLRHRIPKLSKEAAKERAEKMVLVPVFAKVPE